MGVGRIVRSAMKPERSVVSFGEEHQVTWWVDLAMAADAVTLALPSESIISCHQSHAGSLAI